MNYELINPSDAVTFIAPSLPAAFLAVMLVGGGHYGTNVLDDNGRQLEPPEGQKSHPDEVPLFLFGGAQAWGHERWPEHVPPGSSDNWGTALIEAHRADLVATLRSFCTGSWRDRQLFDAALAAIDDPAKRAAFIADWDDKKRSSLNGITNRAHAIADRLETEAKETVDAES